MDTRLSDLLNHYLLDQLTAAERLELLHLLEGQPQVAALEALVLQQLATGYLAADEPMAATEEKLVTAVLQQIRQETATAAPVRTISRHRWRWAAAVLLVLAGSVGWLYHTNTSTSRLAKTPAAALDVAPGKAGAVLTLANGTQVVLDSLGDGRVTTQNGTQVAIQQGKLVYAAAAGKAGEEMVYNTMSTPKGRQFSVVLPDGTTVWMNAASTLRFPVSFEGGERKVSLSGEAYFEVADNAAQPFIVQANGTTVQVLGTHFNINSYANESATQTTLLEGAVQVQPAAAAGKKVVLHPGQQARVQQDAVTVANAAIDQVMAWKNGIFNFNNASVQEIMRQLERWYDIDVAYEKGIPNIQFVGSIGKDLTLLEALDMMKGANLHFRMEGGRRLVILP